MIILISRKDNTNIKKIIENYKKMINLPYIECPKCNSKDLIKWGTYERNIIYIDLVIRHETIQIQRVKCKKCCTTHALLPSYIIPYKINLLDVILSGITNDDVTISISGDTIDKWNKEFNKFLPYLKTMFNNRIRSEIIIKLRTKLFKYYEAFYNRYKKIIMMRHKGIFNVAYFKIGHQHNNTFSFSF